MFGEPALKSSMDKLETLTNDGNEPNDADKYDTHPPSPLSSGPGSPAIPSDDRGKCLF